MIRRSSAGRRPGRAAVGTSPATCGILLACALACARTSAAPPPPAPATLEPARGYFGTDTPVVLRGEGFTPQVVQHLAGGGLDVETNFRVDLGTTELRDVRWMDSRTIAATVPGSLPAGTYPVFVEGPFGRGTAADVFQVLDGPPASLSASAAAPQRARVGEEFLVPQTVSNGGGMAALRVAAAAATASGPAATIQTPPEAADIPAGGSHDFSWRVVATGTGQLQLELPVAGIDEVDGRVLSVGTSALITIDSPAHLVATAQPVMSPAPMGALVQLAIEVFNDGGSDALGVQFAPLTGSSKAQVISAPGPQDVPAGAARTFVWTIQGISSGAATLATSGAGADAGDGSSVGTGPVQWASIVFQISAPLGATLSVLSPVLVGETFTVTLTVTNGSPNTAAGMQPGIAIYGSAADGLSRQSTPQATDIAPGQTVSYTWTYTCTSLGTLQIIAGAWGADATTGAWLYAQASGNTRVGNAGLVSPDPFADGTSFSYVFAYSNRVYLGPSKDGTRAVRMNPDGTGLETVQLAFVTDTGPVGVLNGVSPTPAAFPSLGYNGCTPNSLQCGPDNEDGRGLFHSFTSGGTERLFAGSARSGTQIRHSYITSDTSAAPSFPYIRTNLGGGMRGVTAAAALGSTLYVGVANGGGAGAPAVLPIADPFDSAHVGTAAFPSQLVSTVGAALVDSMAGFSGTLYAANAGGCGMYDGLLWLSCKPSDAAWTGSPALTPVTTTKTWDLAPSDKAVPQMAVFNGRLYLARNTTSGPQLWGCTPLLGFPCSPASWSLIAPNGSGNAQLTQFDDSSLMTISLLVATSQHLYVGYDGAGGIKLYRSTAFTPTVRGDFGSWITQGFGNGVTQILDGRALTFAGVDFLYLAARAGTGPVQVYRAAR